MNSDHDKMYGMQRMRTVFGIANKRIKQTKRLLGIPEDITRDELLVTRNTETVELISETVDDVNRMLNLELISVGIQVAIEPEISDGVDRIRAELAQLIEILTKGYKPGPVVDKVAIRDSEKPVGIMVASIISIIVAAFLIIIAVDSDK